MATFNKIILSGSTYGKAIKVVATSSSGTLIHTTSATSSNIDEIWLYAYNSSVNYETLTIQFGGTTSPDNDIKIQLAPTSGLTLIVAGLILTGASSLSTYAYASTTNVITVSGYVNRIS